MSVKEELSSLAQKYGLKYQCQDFENCYGGDWWVCTHSLYNESGCFTIHCLPQRAEVEFYFAERFSRNRSQLCDQEINVYEFEKEIWEKDRKIGSFKIPFYYWNRDRIIKALIKVITALIEKNNEFFGVKISPP